MACGCGCPLVGGTFCAVSQKCTRTIVGSDTGLGCFFLVLYQCLVLGECRTFSTSKWIRIGVFSLRSLAESAGGSVFGPRRDARTWKTGHCFYELHVAEKSDDGQHFLPLSAAFFGLLFGFEALRFRVAN